MTINPNEVKVETTPPKDNVDTNLSQEKLDTNLSQQVESKVNEPIEDPNWKAFREARKKDRSEREAAEKRAEEKQAEAEALKAAMEAILNKPSTNSVDYGRRSVEQKYESYPEDESEDERIEKKVQAAISKREAQYQLELVERERQEYPRRLLQTYSDFNQTISQDNLDYLDYHYPEVSRPLQRLGDDYDKWSDIYKAIKKFVPNNTTSKKEAARADTNYNKPKSISSTGLTQPHEGLGNTRLTEDRKRENWERMERVRKGVS